MKRTMAETAELWIKLGQAFGPTSSKSGKRNQKKLLQVQVDRKKTSKSNYGSPPIIQNDGIKSMESSVVGSVRASGRAGFGKEKGDV